MTKETYTLLENYMLCCMEVAGHDAEHVYRVLYNALLLAEGRQDVDTDVLITACLLHDIGRKEQAEDPSLCHAAVGGEKAYRFLTEKGFREDFARHVKARLLFDADKLDATGAIGIARTLAYEAEVGKPLYVKRSDGSICNGENTEEPSFFHEYKFKLEGLYGRFYTEKGRQMAESRRRIAADFYAALYAEVNTGCTEGRQLLNCALGIEN